MPDQNQAPTPEVPREQYRQAPQSSWKQNAGIPVAIVVAALVIAGAIYFDNEASTPTAVTGQNDINTQVTPEIVVEPVTEDDYIRGNPNAPIVIIEYSDYDCPFCKNFHETMNRIMDEYGPGEKVAWVYRHFPLQELHINAPKIAEASYCVAELAGNNSNKAFWTFSDLVFETREMNAQTDMEELVNFAVTAGVDRAKFELCLNSNKYQEQVAADVQEALAAGARGTPHSIVKVGNQQGMINGAQPYEAVKQIVDNLISQLGS